MTRITAVIRGFAAFWWDFIVGDDWQIAAGVVVSLAGTAVLATTTIPAWWLLPVAIPALLLVSLRRVTRNHH
jgi:hypothetical protein